VRLGAVFGMPLTLLSTDLPRFALQNH
jgi:hypothetical protein